MTLAATPSFSDAADEIVAIGRRFYTRGWVMGTSGNFSTVLSRAPLRLAITASALPKGDLTPRDILRGDDRGARIGAAWTAAWAGDFVVHKMLLDSCMIYVTLRHVNRKLGARP